MIKRVHILYHRVIKQKQKQKQNAKSVTNQKKMTVTIIVLSVQEKFYVNVAWIIMKNLIKVVLTVVKNRKILTEKDLMDGDDGEDAL